MADVDKWIEIAKQCKYLPENDLKVNISVLNLKSNNVLICDLRSVDQIVLFWAGGIPRLSTTPSQSDIFFESHRYQNCKFCSDFRPDPEVLRVHNAQHMYL